MKVQIAYIVLGILSVVFSELSQSPQQVGTRAHPIIFEPLPKIYLSRSAYTLTAYVDFTEIIERFRALEEYVIKFHTDLRDPRHIRNITSHVFLSNRAETFGKFRQLSCDWSKASDPSVLQECRIIEQYKSALNQSDSIVNLFYTTYRRFLKMVDTLEPSNDFSKQARQRRSSEQTQREHGKLMSTIERDLESLGIDPDSDQGHFPSNDLGHTRRVYHKILKREIMSLRSHLSSKMMKMQARAPGKGPSTRPGNIGTNPDPPQVRKRKVRTPIARRPPKWWPGTFVCQQYYRQIQEQHTKWKEVQSTGVRSKRFISIRDYCLYLLENLWGYTFLTTTTKAPTTPAPTPEMSTRDDRFDLLDPSTADLVRKALGEHPGTTRAKRSIYKFRKAVSLLDLAMTSIDSYDPFVEQVREEVKLEPNDPFVNLDPTTMGLLREIEEVLRQAGGRVKRFDPLGIFGAVNSYLNSRSIKKLKKNVHALFVAQMSMGTQLQTQAKYLNLTRHIVNKNAQQLLLLDKRFTRLKKALDIFYNTYTFFSHMVLVSLDNMNNMLKIELAMMQMTNNVNSIGRYLDVMATERASPNLLSPTYLRKALKQVSEDIRDHPRLQLPVDPDRDIWSYYKFMKIIPVVSEGHLVVILNIPLSDKALHMDVYRVYNLPALHPELRVTFTYELEGKFLAVHQHGDYVALPTSDDMEVCVHTGGHICTLRTALYPTEQVEWCVYALFKGDIHQIHDFCQINTKVKTTSQAISLQGYMWAITTLRPQKLQLDCVEDLRAVDIKPPLTIVEIPNGCEAKSQYLYIPAKTSLTGQWEEFPRKQFFLEFNTVYQSLSRYDIFTHLGLDNLTDLSPEEVQEIASKYGFLPDMTPNMFKNYAVQKLEPYPATIPIPVQSATMGIALLVTVAAAIGVGILFFKHKGMKGVIAPLVAQFGDVGEKVKRLHKSNPEPAPTAPPEEWIEMRPMGEPSTSSAPMLAIEAAPQRGSFTTEVSPEVQDPARLFELATQELQQEGENVRGYKKFLLKKYGKERPS